MSKRIPETTIPVVIDRNLPVDVFAETVNILQVNGKPGQACTPVITTGPNKRYGFEGATEVMPGQGERDQ